MADKLVGYSLNGGKKRQRKGGTKKRRGGNALATYGTPALTYGLLALLKKRMSRKNLKQNTKKRSRRYRR